MVLLSKVTVIDTMKRYKLAYLLGVGNPTRTKFCTIVDSNQCSIIVEFWTHLLVETLTGSIACRIKG